MQKKKMKACMKGCVIGLASMTLVSMMPPVCVDAASWKRNNVGWWWEEDNHSYPVNQWKTINGKNYYFNNRGYMVSGWNRIGGVWYYFGGANDGAMKKNWKKF